MGHVKSGRTMHVEYKSCNHAASVICELRGVRMQPDVKQPHLFFDRADPHPSSIGWFCHALHSGSANR